MSKQLALIGVLTIPNGGTDSNILPCRQAPLASGYVFVNPAAFTGVVTVRGSTDNTATPQALQNNGTALTLTAATTQKFDAMGLRQISIHSASAEGAARSVQVYAEIEAR